MRIGILTGQCGQLARPAAIRAVAAAAEQVGYSSVWVVDGPAATPLLDPVGVIAATAAVTRRVRLGVGVLVGPDHDPARVARSLTTLALLSEDRIRVALDGPGRQVTAVIDHLGAPRPTVLVPGPDPGTYCTRPGDEPPERIVRAGTVLTAVPLDADRARYHGTAEQVAADVAAALRDGADEVVIGLCGDLSLDDTLDGYARIAEKAADLRVDRYAAGRPTAAELSGR